MFCVSEAAKSAYALPIIFLCRGGRDVKIYRRGWIKGMGFSVVVMCSLFTHTRSLKLFCCAERGSRMDFRHRRGNKAGGFSVVASRMSIDLKKSFPKVLHGSQLPDVGSTYKKYQS